MEQKLNEDVARVAEKANTIVEVKEKLDGRMPKNESQMRRMLADDPELAEKAVALEAELVFDDGYAREEPMAVCEMLTMKNAVYGLEVMPLEDDNQRAPVKSMAWGSDGKLTQKSTTAYEVPGNDTPPKPYIDVLEWAAADPERNNVLLGY